MSFFRRKDSPSIPPPNNEPGPNKLQRAPPQDRYGNTEPQRYGGGPAPDDRYGPPPEDRYGAPPPDRYGAPPQDRYSAARDRYGGPPDRYEQSQQPPQRSGQPQDRYGGPPPDRYGQQQQPPPSQYGSSSGDRYGQSQPPAQSSGFGGPPRGSRPTASDPYSRGDGNVDADRAALFAGRNPDAPKRFGGDAGQSRYMSEAELDRRRAEGGDEEEDVEAIKSSMRQTKQESLASTRNALRIAREAEETGMNTLLKLGDQSEKLADAERHMDMAKYNSMKAEDKIGELKQLNKSIFRPVVVWNKDKKRAAQEAKMLARHEDEREELQRNADQVRDSQNRIGAVTMGGGYGDGSDAPSRGGGYRTQEQDQARRADRKRYQFEGGASDDELEDELDDNLDAIGGAVSNMKRLAIAMGEETDRQNKRLDTMGTKVDNLDSRIVKNTYSLRKY